MAKLASWALFLASRCSIRLALTWFSSGVRSLLCVRRANVARGNTRNTLFAPFHSEG